MTEKEKQTNVGRRDYLKAVGTGIVGLAVGAGLGYVAAPKGAGPAVTGVAVTETVTETQTAAATATVGPIQRILHVDHNICTTFDVHKVKDSPTSYNISHCYDALVKIGGIYPDVTIDPSLAVYWDKSPDATTWTFHLRKGAKFHDGSFVDADAVKYSFVRGLIIAEGFPGQALGSLLTPDSIEVVDPSTVKFTLAKGYLPFVNALVGTLIANPRLIEANKNPTGPYGANGDYGTAWLEQHDAGCGPYVLVEHKPGQYLKYARFPDYWRGWRPDHRYFDELEYRVVPEFGTIQSMLTSRQADHSEPWIPEDVLNTLAKSPGVKVPAVGDITRPIFLMCNNKNKFLSNVHLRRAMSYCFDYDTCLTKIYGSAIAGHERLYSPVAKGFTGWIIPKNAYTYDVGKAKAEFDLSGFKAGEVTLDFLFPSGEEPRRETGLLMKDNATAIGVTVNVVERDWATCMQVVGDPTAFNGYLCVVPAFVSNDPDLMLYTFYHSQSWKSMGGKATYSNCTYLDNPDIDKMIMDARYETDESKRIAIYADLQNWLVDNAVDMWTVQQRYREPMLDDIQGWYYPPMSFPALGSPGNQYYGLWREKL